MTPSACDACLRKSALIGHLGPRLSALLGGLDKRVGGVLALAEEDLIVAVAGRQADRARRFAAGFDPAPMRRSLGEFEVDAACRHGGAYPPALLALADVPPAIYFSGGADRLGRLIEAPVATVVGTRTPSRYATEVAHGLGRGLAAAGVTVVSGLALGIDAAAHRGAVAVGGRPVGVLAGGVDVPYPHRNRALHEHVRAEGVLLSELPPGHRPQRWSFPARNRIMAALGRLTVVVEAAESSGTLITAEFASQLGREVGAVPGRVNARLAAGSNRLLREGAAVIRSPEDALDELLGVGVADRLFPAAADHRGGDGAQPAAAPAGGAGAGASGSATHRLRSRSSTPAPTPDVPPEPVDPPLDATLRRVLGMVEAEETIAAIGRDTGLGPARARAALGRLELMGLVARQGLAGYGRTVSGLPRAAPILADAAPTEPFP